MTASGRVSIVAISLALLLCMLGQDTGARTVIDLTRPFNNDSVAVAGFTAFSLYEVKYGQEAGFWYESNNFCWGDHSGTYIDAPARFARGKWTVDHIPLNHLITPGVIVTKATEDANVTLSVADLETWEQKNDKLQKGVVVLVNFDWGKYHDKDRAKYLGSGNKQPDINDMNFPGISSEAANWLVKHSVCGVGVDTPMVDKVRGDFQTHRIFSDANIYTLGNLDLAELSKEKTKGFTIYALPPKFTEGSAAPVRVMAEW